MPAKKKIKKNKKVNPIRPNIIRYVLWGFLAVLVCLSLYMYIEAHIIHLHHTTVYLDDLPQSFDGTTLLFVSDIHMDPLNSSKNAYNLLQQLTPLNPDILILGGDYSSMGLTDVMFSFGNATALERGRSRRETNLAQFFTLLANIQPPLGKYGVVGNHDADMADDMALLMELGGVRLLKNELFRIEKNGESLVIAGLDDWRTGIQDIQAVAGRITADECVVLISHNPDAFPAVNNHSSKDGGLFADLVLSGHTHGGQITLFGFRSILTSSIYGDRYKGGWYTESGVHLLVSNGTGTFVLPFRLGAEPQAHLITLRRHDEQIE